MILWLEMSTQRVEPGLFTLTKILKAQESLQSWYAYICLAVWSGLLSCISCNRAEVPFHHQIKRPSLFSNRVDLCSLYPSELSPTWKGRILDPLIFWELPTKILPHKDCPKTPAQHTERFLSHTRQVCAAPVIHHTPRFQCLHGDIRSYPEQQLQLNCRGIITLCSTSTETVLVTVNALLKQQLLKYCTRALSERGILR